jgi:hypothetical protein
LQEIYEDRLRPPALDGLLYEPRLPGDYPPSIDWAVATARQSPWPLPRNLVPVLPVDDASFACVVTSPLDRDGIPGEGSVIRWHLNVEKPEHQAALLDTDVGRYVQSVADELAARQRGLTRMLDEIGRWYEFTYLDNEKSPRDFVLRPVRLACQNVILGYAAFAQDTSFDGLSVLAWQTCELPHVAAHEGNRALAALTLCDAYQSGGTMEIRFDRPARLTPVEGTTKAGQPIRLDGIRYHGHPEMQVPASLRRYGRTVGVELGADDPGCISPAEARELFLAVTPMPDDLAVRVAAAARRGVASPERLCFSLLAAVWREIELDYMLAVSDRAGQILRGGAAWQQRPARQAEAHVARTALMVGMLYRRLDTKDTAATAGEARVLEDNRVGVTWSVVEELGAVIYNRLRAERLPWQASSACSEDGGSLIAVPRTVPQHDDVEIVRSLSQVQPSALVVPQDADLSGLDTDGLLVLRCPDRLGELDLATEDKLLKARVARA